MGIDCFIDVPDGSPRDTVHLLYADEKVKPEYVEPSASVDDVDDWGTFRVVQLAALVKMKLNSFRDKDRTHLRDMISLDILNESWIPRLHPVHAERLQQLLDDPDG